MAISKTKGRAKAGRTGGIVSLDPTSGPLEKPSGRKLAARPSDLDGQVIGLVTNGLGRSQEFMSALSEELAKISRPGGFLHVVKNSVSIAPERADWARLTSEASVAITGFGG
jgi:hypothetical protein